CGSFTSSAEVATTSKPMKAEHTSAAPDSTPATPRVAGAATVGDENSGCAHPPALQPVGTACGTKGERLSALKHVSPTTITNTTMPTLMMVNTWLTGADILVPMISSAVNTPTMNSGPQSIPSPSTLMVVGMCTSNSSKTVAR